MIVRTNLDGSRTAVFSDCLRYRYELLIKFTAGAGVLIVCLANPSTADEQLNDPTVRKCCKYAATWGYGALLVLNAFAIRSTDPDGMLTAEDPYGDWVEPNKLVESIARHGQNDLLAGWGNLGLHRNRQEELLDAFARAGLNVYALHLNDSTGCPQHPLYVKDSQKPFCWKRSTQPSLWRGVTGDAAKD